VSIAPNSCVIWDEKPHFLGVSEILRRSAEHTKSLLGLELKIRLGELSEAWHAASLERIFIENRLYQLIEGCKSREEAYSAVDKGLEPFKMRLRREVTLEDVQKLTELKFIRISRYDSEKADNEIRQIEEDLKSTQYDLDHLTEYAVAYSTSASATSTARAGSVAPSCANSTRSRRRRWPSRTPSCTWTGPKGSSASANP